MYIHGSEFSKMFKGQAERECFKKIEGPMLENMHCWTSCLISPCYGSIKTSQYCFTAPFLCYHAMSIWWQEALQGHIKAMIEFFFFFASFHGREVPSRARHGLYMYNTSYIYTSMSYVRDFDCFFSLFFNSRWRTSRCWFYFIWWIFEVIWFD